MTGRSDLRKLIKGLALVRGRVMLSSGQEAGQEADQYVDMRRLTLHHAGAPLVGRVMLDLLDDWQFDAGGALPPARTRWSRRCRMSRRLKEGRSTRSWPERVDTSTTGGSVRTAADVLRQAGGEVVGVAVIVDRGAEKAVRAAGLSYRSAYSLADLGQEA